jgi:hypothetical protein
MSILLVTGVEGARNCADVIQKQLEMDVEVADGRKAALGLLRQREFAAVVVDETVAGCDPAGAEAIWERAGLAIPLQINFAVSGAARLTGRSGPPCTAGKGNSCWPAGRPPPRWNWS